MQIAYSINYVNMNFITILICFLFLLFYFIIFKAITYYIQNVYAKAPCNLIDGISNAKCNKYLSENVNSYYYKKNQANMQKLNQIRQSLENVGSSVDTVNQDKNAFLNSLKSTARYSTKKLMDVINGIYMVSQMNLGDLYTQYNTISNSINNNLSILLNTTLPQLQQLANTYNSFYSTETDSTIKQTDLTNRQKYEDFYNAIYNMIQSNQSFFQNYIGSSIPSISSIPKFDKTYGITIPS